MPLLPQLYVYGFSADTIVQYDVVSPVITREEGGGVCFSAYLYLMDDCIKKNCFDISTDVSYKVRD